MSYTAEIIAVGTEILLGNIAKTTDAQDISQALSELGINVYFHTVGDNPERLKMAVPCTRTCPKSSSPQAASAPRVTTSRRNSCTEAFGKQLLFDETEAEKIPAAILKISARREMTENNLQQAYLPKAEPFSTTAASTASRLRLRKGGQARVLMLSGAA
jgi:nicotinamide-nucleotide amidase